IRDFLVTGVQTCALPIFDRTDDRARGIPLPDEVGRYNRALPPAADVVEKASKCRQHGCALGVLFRLQVLLEGLPENQHTQDEEKIGRASCRERVWSTVVG